MQAFILKYLTWELLKVIGFKLIRIGIKHTDNKVDDSLLSIKDKIDKGDTNIDSELDTIVSEIMNMRNKDGK